ncbi:MAG: hypothetical protein HY040_04705 [Planctomycetes bacterium]|nr:hypothetical protein [Planctomycetota bacterium]
MRLTLRTLLAYLDDTLDPAQAKLIGQKLGESESAQKLVDRIKEVTRRRRLTTPPSTGPSGIDPNTIADYLDNVVSPEQASEVEEICLSSDVHLAEVAACHQILTLILGEPASVPPSANQRMYGLVKGPEAIPFRKPATAARAEAEHHVEPREVDETLRLGLPPVGRKDSWTNRLILLGGGVVAAGLLIFALFQFINPGPKERDNKGGDRVAQNKDGDKPPTSDKVDPGKDDTKGKGGADKQDGTDKKPTDKTEVESKDGKKEDESKVKIVDSAPSEIPLGPPSDRQAAIGHMIALEKGEPTLLLQMGPEKTDWKRVLPKKKEAEIFSARPLLALPSMRGEVELNKGLHLMLWGTMPEQSLVPGLLYESIVELYTHETLDLDMLLQRGRIVLTCTREKPAVVRVRFENPTLARQEFADITFQAKDASILVDRFCIYPPPPSSEPFYKDPKNANRLGPVATVGFSVLSGTVFLKFGDVTHTLSAPPEPFQLVWNSRGTMTGPNSVKELPAFLTYDPALPKGSDAKPRKETLRARENLVKQLSTKALDVVLTESLSQESADRRGDRRLALRAFAAIDDLTSLVEAIENPKSVLVDVRANAREALRDWIGSSRDNDYKLFDVLTRKFKKKEAEIIMDLLHGLSTKETQRPERFELLIEYLTSQNQVIRELAFWNLYTLAPAGRNIQYNSAAESEARAAAAAAWRALIPAGQLPPPPPKK